jgi:hypothetical protein
MSCQRPPGLEQHGGTAESEGPRGEGTQETGSLWEKHPLRDLQPEFQPLGLPLLPQSHLVPPED